MYLCPKMLFATALLLTASGAIAQERYRSNSPDPELVARLSYDNSGPVRHGDMHHLCIAVFRDGEYRMVRSWDERPIQWLQGKMAKEESRQLFKLLQSAELRSLSGTHEGLIREQAESFGAEIPVGDQLRDGGADDKTPGGTEDGAKHDAWRLQWVNGDGKNPFPASVSKVVDWLRSFQPKGGTAFDYDDYPDVCPAGGVRLLQPSVAGK